MGRYPLLDPGLVLERRISRGEPCELIDNKAVRMTEHFNLYTRDEGRYIQAPDAAPAAFADHYLALGAQPVCGGYMLLSCIACALCLPARTILPEFTLRADHRRVLAMNRDVRMTLHDGPPDTSLQGSRHVKLFRQYAKPRFHANDKDFDIVSAALELHGQMRFPGMRAGHVEARTKRGRLIGGLVFHTAEKAAYATVFYYDPPRRATSLSQAMLLTTISHLQDSGFQHLYLAQWSRVATAFSWKDGYTPLEVMMDGTWQRKNGISDMRALRVGGGPAYPAAKAHTVKP